MPVNSTSPRRADPAWARRTALLAGRVPAALGRRWRASVLKSRFGRTGELAPPPTAPPPPSPPPPPRAPPTATTFVAGALFLAFALALPTLALLGFARVRPTLLRCSGALPACGCDRRAGLLDPPTRELGALPACDSAREDAAAPRLRPSISASSKLGQHPPPLSGFSFQLPRAVAMVVLLHALPTQMRVFLLLVYIEVSG